MGATVEQRAWKALAAIEDFDEGASIFSGDDRDRAYFVNGTQVANIAEGGIALRLTRKVISAHRARFKEDPRVLLLRSGSDWIGVRPARVTDIDLVVELGRLAADVHRPAPGTPRKPPPSGPELDRRRKFH